MCQKVKNTAQKILKGLLKKFKVKNQKTK